MLVVGAMEVGLLRNPSHLAASSSPMRGFLQV